MTFLYLLLLVTVLQAYQVACLKKFHLEDLVPPRIELYPEKLDFQWISDTEYVYTEPVYGIRKYNAQDDVAEILLSEQDLALLPGQVESYSKDANFVLLVSNKRKVFRYSSVAEYSVYDIINKNLHKIGKGALQVVVWGSGKSLAYVQHNNVHYVPDVTHSETEYKLTKDGKPGEIYYGVTDWIYEEEVFNAQKALWFSPTSSYMAIAMFNDSQVESATFPYYGNPGDVGNQYPKTVGFKYPKAGRTNPMAYLQVHKLNDLTKPPLAIPAPVDLVTPDYILGRVNWASAKDLIVLWLNRRQNLSVLMKCDMDKDKCDIVKEYSEPDGWIDINEPLFDDAGMTMIDVQPMDHGTSRYKHVTKFNFGTFETIDLTPGNSTVTSLLGWDQITDTVYFTIAPENVPWQRQMWASTSGVLSCISCAEPLCHSVSPKLSTGSHYAIITCSSVNNPPKTFLLNTQDASFKLLNANNNLRKQLSQYELSPKLFNVISLEDDVTAHIKLDLPPNMVKDKKYPMIVRVYAGPGSTRVMDTYELDYNTYLTTNRSFIVASIDVRGSGAMSVDAMHAVNNALGTVEVTDTLDAVRRIIQLYPFIDEKKVGVWGWSYGGFTTTMMLIKDIENTLLCGAAVAPVTSWLYYDSIYTERYMDVPENNPEGYKESDVTLQAEKLRGKKFLLVHGSGDDNVHYQNSMLLAKKLQHADIAFEQMSYTDESHSLMGVSRHFYHTLDHFWTQCFA